MRLLFWLLLAYIGYRIVRSLAAPARGADAVRREREAAAAHRDPVCGMYVAEEDAVILERDGRRMFFCSRDCLATYQQSTDNTSHIETNQRR